MLSVILPCYNEEANIEPILNDIWNFFTASKTPYEIVAVNDGSRDRTGALLKRWQSAHPELAVVTHHHNKGYGAALQSGFAAARGDLIFFTDSDRQFDIGELASFMPHIANYDFVIGYRRVRRDPRGRVMLAGVFRILSRMLFGINVRDVNCAFKLFRAPAIKGMRLTQPGALINLEIFALAKQRGYRFLELPVTHHPRTQGAQTGGSMRVVLKAFADLFRLRRQIRKHSA
jgi:glycosyltransferase involved in cell wall biosynthesis